MAKLGIRWKEGRNISRRLPSGDKRRGLKTHTKLVGEVVWAWNDLHLAYAFTFANCVEPKRSWIGQAIWTALNNDSSQRATLEGVLWFIGSPRGAAAGLRWALKETGRLAGYRNDVVHGPMLWMHTEGGLRPSFDYFGNPIGRLLRYVDRENEDGFIIAGPDINRLMILLRGDLMVLAGYVRAISRAIVAEKPSPLPRRPRLLARKFALAAEKQASPPKHRRGRDNRPRPSLG